MAIAVRRDRDAFPGLAGVEYSLLLGLSYPVTADCGSDAAPDAADRWWRDPRRPALACQA
jgi:hypothetical protein